MLSAYSQEIPACTPTFRTSVSLDKKDLQQKWEAILEESDLSMDRGSRLGGEFVVFGHRYLEDDTLFDYEKPDTNARQIGTNTKNVEQMLVLMAGGMSQREAAKKIGIAPQHASRAIKRYQSRIAPRPTVTNEGDQ